MAHLAYGVGLMWLRRLDEAEHSILRSIELDPNLSEAYGALGNVSDFRGQHERAITLFERAMLLDPQWDLWIQACGRAQYALQRYANAEASFKRRLIRLPRSDVTRAYLASLYGNTGRHDEARKMWQELMQINPAYTVEHMRQILPYKDPVPMLVDVIRMRIEGRKIPRGELAGIATVRGELTIVSAYDAHRGKGHSVAPTATSESGSRIIV